MAEQVKGVMDMMGFLHPDLQLVFLFDWSSGHSKNQDGGMAVLQMNSKYGGKKGNGIRDTDMVEGCLGEGEAKLWKVLDSNGGCSAGLRRQRRRQSMGAAQWWKWTAR